MDKFIRILLLLLIPVLMTGCTEDKSSESSQENEIQPGGTFIRSSSADAVILNPILYNDSPSGRIIGYIFDGLIKFSPKNEPEPDLAESWEYLTEKSTVFVHLNITEDNGLSELITDIRKRQDSLPSISEIKEIEGIDKGSVIIEINFRSKCTEEHLEILRDVSDKISFVCFRNDLYFDLREDVRWSDGTQFSAADVVFTYQKILDPSTKAPWRSDFCMIKEVEAIDRFRVRMIYLKPFAPALEFCSQAIIPKHIFENEDIQKSQYNRNPIGTGAYVLTQWVPDEYIMLTANPDHFNGRPNIEKILIKILPDKSQQFIELKNGTLDYMGLSCDQYIKQSEEEDFTERFNLYRLQNISYYSFIGYNCDKPPFDRPWIRNALAHAINHKEIIEEIYYGFARKAVSPFPGGSWAEDPEVTAPGFDTEKCRELFVQNGYTYKDEILYTPEGEVFEVDFLVSNGSKEHEMVVNMLASYWKTVGIKVNINMEEWSNFLAKEDAGEFDAVYGAWSLGIDPDIHYVFHSSNIPNEEHPSSNNFCRYSSEEVDSLLVAGRYTLDQRKREDIYHKIHRILIRDQPYTYHFARDSFLALHKRFHGVEPDGESIFYNFNDWYVPPHLRKY